MRREPIGLLGAVSGLTALALLWVVLLVGAGYFFRAAVWLFCFGYGCN